MRIVLLDYNSIGTDIDVTMFRDFGDFEVFNYTAPAEVADRVLSADIVIANKSKLNSDTLKGSNVRLICLTATGTDNVDIEYCRQNKIAVCNVKGYSTESVVQHTFAMLFTIWEKMRDYDEYTSSGDYIGDKYYGHFKYTFHEMNGKRFGIIGMGAIGSRVAEVAAALGFEVCYWSSSGEDRNRKYKRVELDELISTCDVISINSPLNDKTRGLINRDKLVSMKKTAILLNLGRGPIIDENDLTVAIESEMIGGAALDVLAIEPMSVDSPYARILKNPRFLMTPHVAWAAVEARKRCIGEVYLNIVAWIDHNKRNRVDL